MAVKDRNRHGDTSISMDCLYEVLDSHQAIMLTKPEDDLKFRELTASINGIVYQIEWWINISYLTTPNGAILPFHDVAISGTWPNAARLNVQFRYYNEVCFIIPLEDYPQP
jgi:hypothetical protein